MSDKLMPSPRRTDRVTSSRLETDHLKKWNRKELISLLRAGSFSSIPAKPNNQLEPVLDLKDSDSA